MRRSLTVSVRSVLSIALVAVLQASPALAQQMTPIFRMNYSAGSWPNAGWPNGAHKTEHLGTRFTEAHFPLGGPSGQNAGSLAQISATHLQDYGGQHSWGWEHLVDNTGVTYGHTRFYRWRMRVASETNAQGASWADGGPSNSGVKVLIVGNDTGCSSGNHCRFIAHFEVRRSDQRIRILMGTDANIPANAQTDYIFPKGVWLNVQLQIRASTAYGRSDGELRLWVNRSSFSSPDLIVPNFQMNAIGFRSVGFGLFNNFGLQSGGIFKWDHADFEFDDEFDPNWNTGGTTIPAPASPTNVRVVRLAAMILPGLLPLGLLCQRRQSVRGRKRTPERN